MAFLYAFIALRQFQCEYLKAHELLSCFFHIFAYRESLKLLHLSKYWLSEQMRIKYKTLQITKNIPF